MTEPSEQIEQMQASAVRVARPAAASKRRTELWEKRPCPSWMGWSQLAEYEYRGAQ